jgi:spore coat protein U-like protein
MRKTHIAPIAAGVLLALAGTAQAATKTAGFQVSANVVTNCVISATDLALGTFDGTNNLASTSTITVSCTNGTGYVVDLNTGSSGSFTARALQNGGSSLFYNLYTAGDYLTIWGDDSPGTENVAGSGDGMANADTLTVHGRLLASDNTGPIDAGSYIDQITATITY